MTVLMGLDFGTGGAKACLMTPDGRVLSYAYREYQLIHERPGWSEHDATQYWPIAAALIRQVLDGSGVHRAEVAGIAVSCALPSLVVIGANGEVLCPAINLLDRRAREEAEIAEALVGADRMQTLSGNRVEDHPSIVNLMWMRRHRGDLFQRIRAAMTIDGYVAFRLTGNVTVNRSAAAFYGVAYDIQKGLFDRSVLDIVEVPAELLPEVVDCRAVIGPVTRDAAMKTGLQEGTPVAGGQVDCNAGWLAAGAIESGDVQLNLGTCGVLGVVHDRPEFMTSECGKRMVNIPYTTNPASTYSAVATTMTGGQALRYLRETFGQVELQMGKALGLNAYDLLTLQARDVPPGSDGLIVLPYLMGERTPIWDSSARGVIFGLSLHHTRGHVIRAFMEGVAYALNHSLSVLVEGGLDISWPLVMNEGGARSDVWRQIITDVLGVPTVTPTSPTGAPVGDAILAGVAVGEVEDFSVVKKWVRYGVTLEPDQWAHDRYLDFYDIYRCIYEDTKTRYRQLAAVVDRSSSPTSSFRS